MVKKIAFYLFFIIIIILSGLVWPYIKLPYEESSIISEYTKNNYNQYNDLVRYIVFISIPSLIILIYFLYTKQLSTKNFLEKIEQENYNNQKLEKNLKTIFFIFLLFLSLEFLSVDFPMGKIDSFHEGQQMSAAYKFNLDGSLWSGSYVTVGIIYELIASKLIWNFFDIISIGSTRFLNLLFIYTLKVLLVIFSFQVSKISKLDVKFSGLFFILTSYISINLIDYYFQVGQLIYREIPVVLMLIIFSQFILGSEKLRYLTLLLGPISCLSIFFSIDRGLVTNLIIFCFLIYLILNKNLKFFLISLFTLVLSWIFSYYYLGEEFHYFLLNTLSTLNEINQIGGIIHPIPFSDEPNASRALKSLILIALSLVVSFDLIFKKKSIFSKNFIFIIFIISILSFLSYGYAVGRSDGPHIKSSFGYIIIFYSFLIICFLLKIISEKRKYFDSRLKNNESFYFCIILIFLFFFQNLNFNNIYNIKNRLHEYVNLNDKIFLNDEEINFINKANKVLKNYECVQLFTNDVLILYLLKKPSCTKFYYPITIGSEKNQRQLISELKNTKIIISDNDNDSFSANYRLPLVKNYISKNYNSILSEGNWLIMMSSN